MAYGRIWYLEIPSNCTEDAADFYTRSFRLKVRVRDDGNLTFDDTGVASGT